MENIKEFILDLIEKNPNDRDLGKKIREHFSNDFLESKRLKKEAVINGILKKIKENGDLH